MTTRIWLICSAALARPGFPADEPAPQAGLAKLRRLPVGRNARCVSSPLLRARQTAEALGLNPTPDPALCEADYGIWAGCDIDTVLSRDPQGFAQWLVDPTAAPHGGDSFARLALRMGEWLAALTPQQGEIVAVTHPGPIQAAILHVLDAPLASARAIGVKPLSRTRLTHDSRRWSLVVGDDELWPGSD